MLAPRLNDKEINSFSLCLTKINCQLSMKMKFILGFQIFYYFQIGIHCEYISYAPGDLTVEENGLILSSGLRSRIIAESGKRLNLINGLSDEKFLNLPGMYYTCILLFYKLIHLLTTKMEQVCILAANV